MQSSQSRCSYVCAESERRITAIAHSNGTSMSEIVNWLLETYLPTLAEIDPQRKASVNFPATIREQGAGQHLTLKHLPAPSWTTASAEGICFLVRTVNPRPPEETAGAATLTLEEGPSHPMSSQGLWSVRSGYGPCPNGIRYRVPAHG